MSRVALTACLTVSLFAESLIAGVIESSVRSDSHVRLLELILLPEKESWLILAGGPLVAKSKETGQKPVLLALCAQRADRTATANESSADRSPGFNK